MSRDHLFDPQAPYCIDYGVAKLTERGGRYRITIPKTNNNQLYGSHLLWECMAWEGHNTQSSVGNGRACTFPHSQFLQWKWRHSGGGPGALYCHTSSKGHRQHQRPLTHQSNMIRKRVAPVDDGQGSLIWPLSPILNNFRVEKFAERAGDNDLQYQNQTTNNCMACICYGNAWRGRDANIMGCKIMWAPRSSIIAIHLGIWRWQPGPQY